jgi:mRNA interferase RelE/StbE
VAAPGVCQVEFDPDTARELRTLAGDDRGKILRYLRTRIATAEDPTRFGQPLLGDHKGFWRYRVGDFRIIDAEGTPIRSPVNGSTY